MKVKWLGHASFLLTAESGSCIITDPYQPGAFGTINYGPIEEPADIVTVSHDHGDHNDAKSIKGNPQIVNTPGERQVSGIRIKGIPAHHDTSGGRERGSNIIFCFTLDGMNVCHAGDLGHQPTAGQLSQIGQVDVLLVPVGGKFTLDAKGANDLVETLKTKVVIPMHFKTPKCDLPLAGVDDFLKMRKDVKRLKASEVSLKKEALPSATETLVLEPAL
ncbi:MAG: MBL fold metallo-hydrolase [Chloroflexi bacterium]|nr:MBL fold metallo-hydrolase [Chloroflexota bacterium]